MPPNDPFPIERCSRRLKAAILAEFHGHSPTVQDILSIPLKKWKTVPGVGQALLTELESILQRQSDLVSEPTSSASEDADLIARLEHLQRGLKKLQQDVQALMNQAALKQSDLESSDLQANG